MILARSISALCTGLLLAMSAQAVQIRREPGHRIPEYILPTERDNPALWTPSTYLMTTRAVAPGVYATNDIPRTGTIEYPLILVDFTDKPFSIRDTTRLLERYNQIFNEQDYTDNTTYIHKGVEYHGATGSVSDYFRDQSYGQYIPKFRIIGPIHPSQSYAWYGKGKDDNVNQLVREICTQVIESGLADLSEYARNGTIDQLSIIYAGKGENYDGSDQNTIWPQASYLDIDNRNNPVIYRNGIRRIKYACTCELFWDSDTILDGIGTFCHEFSHTLGLPDFYNTASESESVSNAPMGYWSIMDYGIYENGGFSPVGYTAFEKYSLGWLDIEEIDYTGIYTLEDIGCKPDPEAGVHTAYRLNTGLEDQFIILENHAGTGWYRYHAAKGLMVTAVNYDNNSWIGNNVNRQRNNKRYAILPADNNYERSTNSGDLFPYKDIDSITTLGTPVLKAGSSYPLYSIYDIKLENSLVAFQARPDIHSAVESPREQDISISVTDGELSVTAPAGSSLSVYDISGKPVLQTETSAPVQQVALPGNGIWIVKCGKTVRKLRVEN